MKDTQRAAADATCAYRGSLESSRAASLSMVTARSRSPYPSEISGQFRPLSSEENETFRKWRRAAIAFYGTIVISVALLSVVIGPPPQTAVKSNPAYSAIASRGQNQSH